MNSDMYRWEHLPWETIERQARQGPDGKVKAKLPEPQCPIRKVTGPETMVVTGWGLEFVVPRIATKNALRGIPTKIAYSSLKDTKRAPKPS